MLPTLNQHQERAYLILTGIFLGTLGIVNILGLSRFIDLSFTVGHWTVPMVVPVGVLPYPITFLCMDIITEFYGKSRANVVVWTGLGINLWLFLVIWLAGLLPPSVSLPGPEHPEYAFFTIRTLTMSSIIGSMTAYLFAQLLDVHIFHWCKTLTRGKYLWFRNNVSTLISQLIDTVIVTAIAYYLAGQHFHHATPFTQSLFHIMLASYSFKILSTAISTFPFYLSVKFLTRLGLPSYHSVRC